MNSINLKWTHLQVIADLGWWHEISQFCFIGFDKTNIKIQWLATSKSSILKN